MIRKGLIKVGSFPNQKMKVDLEESFRKMAKHFRYVSPSMASKMDEIANAVSVAKVNHYLDLQKGRNYDLV